jgi:hypothetical protein
MATLKEYFEKDGNDNLCAHTILKIETPSGEVCLEVIARVHFDFFAGAKYLSYYIPSSSNCRSDVRVQCPARIVLNSVQGILNGIGQSCAVSGGFVGEEPIMASTLKFTGRLFIYSEDPIGQDEIEYIQSRACELGHHVQFRLATYAEKRNEFEHPLAFISHDSRDKDNIARPLALELQKLMCTVWYDEFSLTVGNSLRASIEKGLRECRKCILILTPNFLENGGWAKREYDSIFTRELVERQNLILPIWSNVSKNEVCTYSPILADRVASKWEKGVAIIAGEMARALRL